MPIGFKIYNDLELMFTIFYGKVDKKDAHDYSKAIYKDPDFEFARKTLVFLRESKLIFSIEDVEEFAKSVINNKKFKMRNKIAILIDSPTDTVAATIYAQTILNYRKHVEVELFYTLDAALRFLGLTSKSEFVNNLISEHSSLIAEGDN
jgi:hypothetical protein